MEEKIAHLTFIQGIIIRMAGNSFLLKGWSVTIIAALFALASQNSNSMFVIISYMPTLMFWGLDAFYLHQEKLFRELYTMVSNNTIKSDNFTLDTSSFVNNVDSYFKVLFSKTLISFHGVIVFVVIVVMLILI